MINLRIVPCIGHHLFFKVQRRYFFIWRDVRKTFDYGYGTSSQRREFDTIKEARDWIKSNYGVQSSIVNFEAE